MCQKLDLTQQKLVHIDQNSILYNQKLFEIVQNLKRTSQYSQTKYPILMKNVEICSNKMEKNYYSVTIFVGLFAKCVVNVS